MPLCVSLVLWVFFFSPRHLRTQSTHDDGYMYHTCTTTHFIPPQCRRAPVSFLHVFTPHWRAGQHRSRAARLSPVSSRAPRAAPCLQMSAGSADEEEMNVREAQAALVAYSTPRVHFRGRGCIRFLESPRKTLFPHCNRLGGAETVGCVREGLLKP